jgi:hypothetical protein
MDCLGGDDLVRDVTIAAVFSEVHALLVAMQRTLNFPPPQAGVTIETIFCMVRAEPVWEVVDSSRSVSRRLEE